MPRPSPSHQPSYRLHKARNCAVVTLDGRNHYLGPWQSPESHERYARLVAEWRRSNGGLPAGPAALPATPLTVGELVLAYFRHAQAHYVKRGEPTSEQGCIKQALRPVRRLYGATPAAEFGPRALMNVREAMVSAGRARTPINKDVHRVRRMFRWAVEEELLPVEVHERLRCVRGLARGKTAARESPGVRTAPAADVEAALPHLPPPVAAMVRFQWLTGCRPQEAAGVRPGDVRDAGDGTWHYRPAGHKTEHLGRERVVVIGPRAQAVLAPYLARDPAAYCFAPADSVRWQFARSRRRPPGEAAPAPEGVNERYARHSCRRAGVPAWSPNRLRHARATKLRAALGRSRRPGRCWATPTPA